MPGALVRHMLPHKGDLDASVSVLAYFLDNLMISLAASKAAKLEEKKIQKPITRMVPISSNYAKASTR